MKKVAIVIPTHKSNLSSDDLLSIRHLKKYLSSYDCYFAIPDDINAKNFKFMKAKFERFDKNYFASWRGYNELLLQQEFYKRFENYDYILIYQLDVLVFSDQLKFWCNENYDYIAPPWFRPVIGWLSHKKGYPPSGGNGGFSLRKVKSALEVLEKVNFKIKRESDNPWIQKLWFIQAILTGQSRKLWLNAPSYNYPFAEDGFWSLEAPKYMKSYKVANFKDALKFGFERYPEKCFKLNNSQLPFGVHAWKKYNEKFWKPFILKKK